MNVRHFFLAGTLALGAASQAALAMPVVYTGYDVGSTSLAGSPLATAAAASFDAAAGSTAVIDFESALPAGVGLTGSAIGEAAGLCSTAALHCYATSGTRVAADNGAVFSFADPIDAFGAYFTGWQIANQTLTLTYAGGATETLDMGSGSGAGGTRFFGFVDAGAAIVGVTYTAGIGASTDYVGLDDVRYRRAVAAPEPATLGLLGLALAGCVRRRV